MLKRVNGQLTKDKEHLTKQLQHARAGHAKPPPTAASAGGKGDNARVLQVGKAMLSTKRHIPLAVRSNHVGRENVGGWKSGFGPRCSLSAWRRLQGRGDLLRGVCWMGEHRKGWQHSVPWTEESRWRVKEPLKRFSAIGSSPRSGAAWWLRAVVLLQKDTQRCGCGSEGSRGVVGRPGGDDLTLCGSP